MKLRIIMSADIDLDEVAFTGTVLESTKETIMQQVHDQLEMYKFSVIPQIERTKEVTAQTYTVTLQLATPLTARKLAERLETLLEVDQDIEEVYLDPEWIQYP